MNKIKKIFATVLCLSIVLVLSGCFEKGKENEGISGDTSGEEHVMFSNVQETYGNDTDIVNYKGNIYYIEYGNNDYTYEALRDPWYYVIENSNNQRYINMINSKGEVKNLFTVNGVNKFSIVDDRFYLQSSTGKLYTVNMKNEDEITLSNKGEYLAFDEEGSAVYYLNSSNPDALFKIDTKTKSISQQKFDNPLKTSGYNYIGIRNGNLYYTYLDKRDSQIILLEHNIKDNVQKEVTKLKVTYNETKYNNKLISDYVVCVLNVGRYSGLCIGTPSDGNMGGFLDREFYVIDLEEKSIDKVRGVSKAKDDDWFDEDSLRKELSVELYKLDSLNVEIPSADSLFTKDDKKEFASRYNIDLDAKLGDEAKDKLSTDPDMEKFIIELEDYSIVGNNVFYKITASRRNPYKEVGWRQAFIRMVTEVYVKNLKTNEVKFLYLYINNNYELMEEKISELESGDAIISGDIFADLSGDVSGEVIVPVSDESKLKDGEMLLEIDTTNIWKSEFDVRVEEVGGMIIGKRIEYEGHHTKDESIIKIKVNKEPGAMLTVYIDGEASSNMVFEQ